MADGGHKSGFERSIYGAYTELFPIDLIGEV
jgi:hypothetical protein